MAGHRIQRVSEDIRREITAVIRELKDPRVRECMLTVVRVDVSSDASFARVHVSALEGLDAAKRAVKGLESATGYIRKHVGENLGLRKTPEIKFIADNSGEYSMEISQILNKLKDEEKHEN